MRKKKPHKWDYLKSYRHKCFWNVTFPCTSFSVQGLRCFNLSPGYWIMFCSDSCASPIMWQAVQHMQEWCLKNQCVFRTEWLKRGLSFQSGILVSCGGFWQQVVKGRANNVGVFTSSFKHFSLLLLCLPAFLLFD